MNDFHTIKDEQFSTLGDMTDDFSASDVSRAAIDGINWYYQEVLNANEFKEVEIDGVKKYEPCGPNEKGEIMTYKDIAPEKLFERKVTFECMSEVVRQSRPSVAFSEVNKHRRFEMKHPSVNILRMGEKELNVTSKKSNKEKKRLRKDRARFKFPLWKKRRTISEPKIGTGFIGIENADETCKTKEIISSYQQMLRSEGNDSFSDTSTFSLDTSEMESSEDEPIIPNKSSTLPTPESANNLLPKICRNKVCKESSCDEPTLPNKVSTKATPHSQNNLKKTTKKISEDSSDSESSEDELIITCKVPTKPTPCPTKELLTNKNCDKFTLGDESFTKQELEMKITSYLELMASACKEEAFNDLANKFVDLISKKKGA